MKIEKVVTATKTPHDWGRHGLQWRCRACGAIAAEFDDNGFPDPYGSVVYAKGMDCVEASCDEMSVLKVMGS